MVMDTLQIRVSKGLVERVDLLVSSGLYANRADVIRDGIRRLVVDKMIGIHPSKKNSVAEVRALRKKLSRQKLDLNEINKLAD